MSQTSQRLYNLVLVDVDDKGEIEEEEKITFPIRSDNGKESVTLMEIDYFTSAFLSLQEMYGMLNQANIITIEDVKKAIIKPTRADGHEKEIVFNNPDILEMTRQFDVLTGKVRSGMRESSVFESYFNEFIFLLRKSRIFVDNVIANGSFNKEFILEIRSFIEISGYGSDSLRNSIVYYTDARKIVLAVQKYKSIKEAKKEAERENPHK